MATSKPARALEELSSIRKSISRSLLVIYSAATSTMAPSSASQRPSCPCSKIGLALALFFVGGTLLVSSGWLTFHMFAKVSQKAPTRKTSLGLQLDLLTASGRCAVIASSWQESELWHLDMRRQRFLYWRQFWRSGSSTAPAPQGWESQVIHGVLPTYTCPIHRRYGGIPDGGKTVCDPKCTLSSPKCLVYSFGVADNCEFEHQLWKEHSNCELHLFDPTPGVESRFLSANLCKRPADDKRIRFHPWGLGGYTTSAILQGKQVELFPLSEIMRRLGHQGRTLDVLKMDVEGSEYDAFKYMFEKGMPSVHLLLLEGHMGRATLSVIKSFMYTIKELENRNFRIYHLERNPFGCWADMEVAMVNKTMLSKAYAWIDSDQSMPVVGNQYGQLRID